MNRLFKTIQQGLRLAPANSREIASELLAVVGKVVRPSSAFSKIRVRLDRVTHLKVYTAAT